MSPSYPELLTLRWSSEDDKQKFAVENPATGRTITTVQGGDPKTVNEAVLSAQAAFANDWRWRTPAERSAYLFNCADILDKHKEELAEILCLENGKPYVDALAFDVAFLVGIFRYFASLVDKLPGEVIDQGAAYVTVLYEPYGVCAGILPFNWPPIHTGGKLAPALAAGNVMILKPGEQAPLTVMRIVDLVSEVLPKDVVQVVPGVGSEVPKSLVEHPLVKMVSFTGSTPSGSKVAQTAALTVTPTVLELGGKNAFVVFDDADFDRAVRDALEGAFFNKGEACTAASRILVQKGIHDRFCSVLGEAVKKLRTGNGMSTATHVGPTVSKQQQEKVLAYLEQAKEIATIAAQGQLPDDLDCQGGYFVPPTLITNVTRDMVIAREEMFGPLVTVTAFETEDEALSIVNDVQYGLTCIIFSKDHEKCWRCARKVDVGMVWINNYWRSAIGTPFGGTKDSGYGREHCIETLRSWGRAKSIKHPSGLKSLPSWRAVKEVFPETEVTK